MNPTYTVFSLQDENNINVYFGITKDSLKVMLRWFISESNNNKKTMYKTKIAKWVREQLITEKKISVFVHATNLSKLEALYTKDQLVQDTPNYYSRPVRQSKRSRVGRGERARLRAASLPAPSVRALIDSAALEHSQETQ